MAGGWWLVAGGLVAGGLVAGGWWPTIIALFVTSIYLNMFFLMKILVLISNMQFANSQTKRPNVSEIFFIHKFWGGGKGGGLPP